MYPNPAQETLNIELDLVETVPVSIEISDIAGTVVTQRNYGNLSGHLLFPIDVTQYKFNPGVLLFQNCSRKRSDHKEICFY